MRHLDPRKHSYCTFVSETYGSCMFRVQKCTNKRKLIVAGMLCDTHTPPASVSYRRAKCCVRYLYIREQWFAYFSYTETVISMCVLHDVKICFTSIDAIFKRSYQIKGQCTDVKSGWGPSVGQQPHSLSKKIFFATVPLRGVKKVSCPLGTEIWKLFFENFFVGPNTSWHKHPSARGRGGRGKVGIGGMGLGRAEEGLWGGE